MQLAISLFLILSTYIISAQQVNIIPQPVELKMGKGNLTISKQTIIAYDEATKSSAEFLKDYLKTVHKIELSTSMHNRDGKKAIQLINGGKQGKAGYYELKCDLNGVSIAGDEKGVFYGIQTLIQLLPVQNQQSKIQSIPLTIPQLTIIDYPRFEYRGMHLDVGRHFSPISFIKKYIDYLALHKLNIFHWHLTEDQGWRIEIKKYPNLTEIGSKRNGTIIGHYPGTGNDNKPYSGFYTQEEIKEVVKYANERFIEVIPEIEMPGHSSAAIAAYPWLSCFPEKPTEIPANMISPKSVDEQKNGRIKLVQETWGVFDDVFCAGKEETFTFLQNVIDEVLPLFPSGYFHIGADECPKTHWKICPNCQRRMKENNLKDEHELQSWFVQRIEKYLNSKSKILIGWDEILEGGLAPNAVVMSWRGEAGGIEAARQKHKVIMTPGSPLYFDHSQSENEDSLTIGGYNPIEKVYAYDPIPKELTEEEGKYILGAQANVWREYMNNEKKVGYMVFPRIAALSEVLWTKKENKNWESFEKRLQEQFKRYQRWKINYSKAYYDLKATILPADASNPIRWKVETKQPGTGIKYITHFAGRPYELTFAEGTPYNSPIEIKSTMLVAAIGQLNGKSISNPVYENFHFNKATGKKITLTNQPSKSYPGDGAFTLVNGVQNEKGLGRSKEFIGFNGEDCIATIDLGKEENISFIKVHYLLDDGAWIYQPSSVTITVSGNETDFTPVILSNSVIANNEAIGEFLQPVKARFVKIQINNFGIIPIGKPGAGTKAWLFIDEIEVN